MTRRLALAVLLWASWAGGAAGQTLAVEGYGDLRAVAPFGQASWLDGGLGKLRFEGESGHGLDLTVPELFAEARLRPTDDLLVVADLRYEQDQKTALDTLEDYVRYRPASTTPLRWSVRAGAFFPPVSLENTALGWTSPWTLTPSAIDSWVGEELRTIGAEGRLEWRLEHGALEAVGAVFGWNDLAGTLLADRGWAFGDRPVGLLDHFRLPDLLARAYGEPVPYTAPFTIEIDNQPGWYGGGSWREDGLGTVAFLHYDNRTDPTSEREEQYGWHTRFSSLSLRTELGAVTLLAQALAGTTEVVPEPGIRSLTDFQAAYALLGWETGDWTLSGRLDGFATQQHNTFPGLAWSEHGAAETLAASWYARTWLRLSAEALVIESSRAQRIAAGLPAKATEAQLELGARFFY